MRPTPTSRTEIPSPVRAIGIHNFGAPDVLGTVDRPRPQPGPDFIPGQRVMAYVNPLHPYGGAQAEYIVTPQEPPSPSPAPWAATWSNWPPARACEPSQAPTPSTTKSSAVPGPSPRPARQPRTGSWWN